MPHVKTTLGRFKINYNDKQTVAESQSSVSIHTLPSRHKLNTRRESSAKLDATVFVRDEFPLNHASRWNLIMSAAFA